MKLRDASLKIFFHNSSLIYFTFIFSGCITITSSEDVLKVCLYNFFQRKVLLLIIYLFKRDSSKSTIFRSSQPPEVFNKKDVLRNFVKFTRKHLCQSLFFKTLAQVFFVNFAKFLRTPFLQNTSVRLLLCFHVDMGFDVLLSAFFVKYK